MRVSLTDLQVEELRQWLALRQVRGVGAKVFRSLLKTFGTPGEVWRARRPLLQAAGLRTETIDAILSFREWGLADEQLQRAQRAGVRVLTLHDPRFPSGLRPLRDGPVLLFVYGELTPADEMSVAVVGSRAVSDYGRRMAREISFGLAKAGVTVVSGLARGTDAEAHRAALAAGGRTVAVLGSGIDVLYPSEHKALARAIGHHGAVISELFMGTKPDPENFPGRNRIISGMALGTVVVEAAEKSGSLITASIALDQGREVFAVPGPVGQQSRGTHRLIREGAKLTQCADDVIEEIAPQVLRRQAAVAALSVSSDEMAVLRAVGSETVHVDGIVLRSGLTAARVLQLLLAMELKGLIEQLPGKFYVALAAAAQAVPTQEE